MSMELRTYIVGAKDRGMAMVSIPRVLAENLEEMSKELGTEVDILARSYARGEEDRVKVYEIGELIDIIDESVDSEDYPAWRDEDGHIAAHGEDDCRAFIDEWSESGGPSVWFADDGTVAVVFDD